MRYPFKGTRCRIDIIFVTLIQIIWIRGNKFHHLILNACGNSPVNPLHVISFHIKPYKTILLSWVHINRLVVKGILWVHSGNDTHIITQSKSIDFSVQNQVHQLLLHRMFCTVDFIDKEQYMSTCINGPGYMFQCMMHGIHGSLYFFNRTITIFMGYSFHRWEAPNFAFF